MCGCCRWRKMPAEGWLPGIVGTDDFVTAIPRPEGSRQQQVARRAIQARDKAIRRAERQTRSLRYIAASLALDKGEVRTRELTGAGVYRPMLGPMCDEGLLTRVRYGVYGPGPKAAAYIANASSGQVEGEPACKSLRQSVNCRYGIQKLSP